jgi:hypothetical protein
MRSCKTGHSRKEYFNQMMLDFISQWPNDAVTEHICPQNPSIPSGEMYHEAHASLSMKSPVFAPFYRISTVFTGTDKWSVPPETSIIWGPLIIMYYQSYSQISDHMDPDTASCRKNGIQSESIHKCSYSVLWRVPLTCRTFHSARLTGTTCDTDCISVINAFVY